MSLSPFSVVIALIVNTLLLMQPVLAASQIENDVPDVSRDTYYKQPVLLRPKIEKSFLAKPITLSGAVYYAQENYPNILKGQAQVKAARENVTVQKLNEYLPDSLFQYQEVMASHNKLSQVIFGSPVFPADTGPGFDFVSMRPVFFSGAGFSLDWAPIDFGLHKARIQLAKSQYDQTRLQYAATALDVEIATASGFLDAVEAIEQVKAAQQNVSSFEQFSKIVRAQVDAYLKPGADASLADAQLANAQNFLYRARLSEDVAIANLANSMGLGGMDLSVDPQGIASTAEPADFQKKAPVFEDVPILQATKSTIFSAIAQKRVLDKEYWPVFHFLGGVQMRGAGLNTKGELQSADVNGVFPTVPNYQIAFIINWNFMDIFRLHAEKKVQAQRIAEQQQDYNLVLQNLKSEDVKSRARVATAMAIAANMPVQVEAALAATRQADARYQTGLGSVAQVAEANQLLAQSRMQEASAKIAVWRALLEIASVHGDIQPFLSEAERIQRGH